MTLTRSTMETRVRDAAREATGLTVTEFRLVVGPALARKSVAGNWYIVTRLEMPRLVECCQDESNAQLVAYLKDKIKRRSAGGRP